MDPRPLTAAATTRTPRPPAPTDAGGPDRSTLARRATAAGAVLAGAAGLRRLGRWVLPASPLPRPTGPHPVGTTAIEVAGARRLPVQVWYPASTSTPSRGTRARLFPSPDAPAVIARRYGVPAWVLAPLSRVRGHAVDGASPTTDPLRGLVVLVHGWLGFRTIHADLAEQLASEGWVVLAADHVGGALVTQHLDGTAEGITDGLMPTEGDQDYWPRARALADRYAEDVSAVLDTAADLAVAGRLLRAPAPTILIGQSTGGGAAVRAAVADERVNGIVGLDPWVGAVRRPDRAALARPMIAIRSDAWVGNHNDGLLAAMPGVELRALPGTVHTDLTGIGYLTPLTRLTGLSSGRPQAAHDAALAAFADLVAGLPAEADPAIAGD